MALFVVSLIFVVAFTLVSKFSHKRYRFIKQQIDEYEEYVAEHSSDDNMMPEKYRNIARNKDQLIKDSALWHMIFIVSIMFLILCALFFICALYEVVKNLVDLWNTPVNALQNSGKSTFESKQSGSNFLGSN